MKTDMLVESEWFHGTESQPFKEWQFPPPAKLGEPQIHQGVFFTSDIQYAWNAGQNIAKVNLDKNIKVLNTIYDYQSSEKLRVAVQCHENCQYTRNINHDYWHEGWKTGDVLRVAFASLDNNPFVSMINQKILELMTLNHWSSEVAGTIYFHTLTKYFIETICQEAKNLGFDALFGYEVDRHSVNGVKLAQPILAVFYANTLTTPIWVNN